MRRRKVWAVLLALLLVASGSVRAGDDDEDGEPPARSGWFARWFGGSEKKPEPKKKPKKKNKKSTEEHRAEKPAELPSLNDQLAEIRSRAKANYFRRLEVCIRLQQIAIDTQDDELLRDVKVLQKRVWDACSRHLDLKQEFDPFESDEDILDRHLGEADRDRQDERVLTGPLRDLVDPVAAEDRP
ncbi:MAG: hypothetical protein AB7K24_16025 [Gemmataceae bacterium]